jgi:putative transposase
MEKYFTPPEIAEIVGVSPQAVRKRAGKWQGGRKRQARGGGYEYPIWALPEEWRSQLLNQTHPEEQPAGHGKDPTRVQTQLPLEPSQKPQPTLHPLADQTFPDKFTSKKEQKKWAALWLLLAVSEACPSNNKNKMSIPHDCAMKFIEDYKTGAIQAPHWVREATPSISWATLCRHRNKYTRGGIEALRPKHQGRSDKSIDNQPEIRETILKNILHRPIHIYNELINKFGTENIPTLATVTRWVNHWREENQQEYAYLVSPHEWEGNYGAAMGSASEGIMIGDRWETDSTKADIRTVDSSEMVIQLNGVRYAVLMMVDVASRRRVVHLSKTSSGIAYCALLRKAISTWGIIPRQLLTDNGLAEIGSQFTQGLFGLRIEHKRARVRKGRDKPFVERGFRDLAIMLEAERGHVGNSIAQRQRIRDRERELDLYEFAISASQFQAKLDQWCAEYDHRPHRGLGGRTPMDIWNEQTPERPWDGNERKLDLLLATIASNKGFRIVQKAGLEVEGGWYIAPELALHIGERVMVKHDPFDHDYGRVWVFSTKGKFICMAANEHRTIDVLGKTRQQIAMQAHKEQKQIKQAAREIAKVIKSDNREARETVVEIKQKAEAKRQQPPTLSMAEARAQADQREQQIKALQEEIAPMVYVRDEKDWIALFEQIVNQGTVPDWDDIKWMVEYWNEYSWAIGQLVPMHLGDEWNEQTIFARMQATIATAKEQQTKMAGD